MLAIPNLKRMLLAWYVISLPVIASGQAVQWSFNYGGSNTDYLTRVVKGCEGGFLAAGHTFSSDTDIPFNTGLSDAWIISTDDEGNKDYVAVLGGSGDELVKDLIQREDSVYLILINSNSSDGDFPVNNGSFDVWVKCMNASGVSIEGFQFGGSGNDEAFRIVPTHDNGYLIVGRTGSFDGTFSNSISMGGDDAFCIRLDAQFQVIWARKYGSEDNDGFVHAVVLPDSNLMFYGSKHIGITDKMWLMKTNPEGEVIDEECPSHLTGTYPVCMLYHADSYYLARNTDNTINNTPGQHADIIVFDEFVGDTLEQRMGITMGGITGSDIIADMKIYNDEYLLCLIVSNSNSGMFPANHGGYDIYTLLMTSGFVNWGEILSTWPLGGSDNEGWALKSASLCVDEDMAVIASNSYSSDWDLPAHYGQGDGWMLRTNPLLGVGLKGSCFPDARPAMVVSPNPAEDEILVSGIPDEAAFITITDLAGRQVSRTVVDGSSVNIPLSGLPSGMYLVRAGAKDRVLPPVKFVRR